MPELPPVSLAVSVVVPTYNRLELLPVTLRALAAQNLDRKDYEIIVVDDGSKQDAGAAIAGIADGLIRLHRQKNRGVAAARNQGARLARGRTVIFNDDDIIAPPEMIPRHLELLDRFDRAMSQSWWRYEPGFEASLAATPFGRYRMALEREMGRVTVEGLPPIDDEVLETWMLAGCNIAVRRDDFWEVGGFDESFPFAGAEDEEFSIRAREKGFKLLLESRVRLDNHDRRIDFEQFCERQRRGAVSRVVLVQKHPSHPQRVVTENDFVRPGDPPLAVARKMAKGLLARPPVMRALQRSVSAVERLAPDTRLLHRLYRFTCALYLYRGVREGLAMGGTRPST